MKLLLLIVTLVICINCRKRLIEKISVKEYCRDYKEMERGAHYNKTMIHLYTFCQEVETADNLDSIRMLMWLSMFGSIFSAIFLRRQWRFTVDDHDRKAIRELTSEVIKQYKKDLKIE